MNTLLLNGKSREDIELAGKILRDGGLVAIPTETVYGLAANALNPKTVRRIFEVKGRPADNPLIVHIAELSDWEKLVRELKSDAIKLAERFFPGPLTVILERSEIVPDAVSAGLPTVSVRMPSHPVARAVIRAAGVPLAAPSANLSGRPSPTKFEHVKRDLMGKVEAIVDGGDCALGVESTVITLAETPPRILRPGAVTVEELREVIGEISLDPAVTSPLPPGESAASPGMKYRHYSPASPLTLVDASPEEYGKFLSTKPGARALCFDEDLDFLAAPGLSFGGRYSGEEQAKNLFSCLLRLDDEGRAPVFAHLPSKRGVGLAVYNRLIRAAGFEIINPFGHMVIGLTGSSGAGKSSVAEILRERGFHIIDCDRLTRSGEVYDEACIRELLGAFGEDIAEDGILNRRKLAVRAFGTAESKKKLENIVFPRILSAVRRKLSEIFLSGERFAVLDAPTLFEAGADNLCARILTVTAPAEERLRRIIERDKISKEEGILRLNAQEDESFYTSRADFVIENPDGGSPKEAAALAADALVRELNMEIHPNLDQV